MTLIFSPKVVKFLAPKSSNYENGFRPKLWKSLLRRIFLPKEISKIIFKFRFRPLWTHFGIKQCSKVPTSIFAEIGSDVFQTVTSQQQLVNVIVSYKLYNYLQVAMASNNQVPSHWAWPFTLNLCVDEIQWADRRRSLSKTFRVFLPLSHHHWLSTIDIKVDPTGGRLLLQSAKLTVVTVSIVEWREDKKHFLFSIFIAQLIQTFSRKRRC